MEFPNKLTIGTKEISDLSPVFIIAEAGINHNGDLGMAFRLVEEAKAAGADAIKFQTFSTRHCESQYSKKPKYFAGREWGQSKLDFSANLEFDKYQFKELKSYCDEIGIIFLSMAADKPSLEILCSIGCPAIKIGSSDTLNFPLFKEIAATKLPVFLSTGISSESDVETSVDYLANSGVESLAIMQCTSQYPAPYSDVNLKVIDRFKSQFGVPAGLSDHSRGWHISLAASARGSNLIEKHFTLSRRLPGVDHIASINPSEFKAMVDSIRDIEMAIGDGHKTICKGEEEHLLTMRKSLFSMSRIHQGQTLTWNQVAAKRPGGGILPTEIGQLIGCKAKVDIEEDEFIQWEMIEKIE
jgi:N-acetylneuraminate synthase/N,N'-diacetyllegionaminate synthase